MEVMMSLEHWLAYGLEQGFCSEVVCGIHNGLPVTEEEMDLWESGDDPCVAGVRIYEPDGNQPA